MSNGNGMQSLMTTTSEMQQAGGGQIATQADNAAASSAATANVLAMHQRAMIEGRDIKVIETDLLDDFKNSRLGEIGVYELPFGKKPVQGLTVQAARQIRYRMKHLNITSQFVRQRDVVVVSVTGTDLVTNISESAQAAVRTTVERKYKDENRELLGTRTNSKGDELYIYPATDQEMLRECNSTQSKMIRNVILNLMPPTMREKVFDIARESKAGKFEKNRDKALDGLIDDFRNAGISARQVGEYLGHNLDTIGRDEFIELRNVVASLNGGSSFDDLLRQKQEKRGDTAKPETKRKNEPAPPK